MQVFSSDAKLMYSSLMTVEVAGRGVHHEPRIYKQLSGRNKSTSFQIQTVKKPVMRSQQISFSLIS